MCLKSLAILLMLIAMSSLGYAQTYHSHALTMNQIDRVRTLKQILEGIDTKTILETIHELERSPYPEINLEIKEAEAKAFRDIVLQQEVKGLSKKQWLYSMVCLNMAYLQFAGLQQTAHTTSLNLLIRQKLKQYLSDQVFSKAGFSYNI